MARHSSKRVLTVRGAWFLACLAVLVRFLLADPSRQLQEGAFGYLFTILTYPAGLFFSWLVLLFSSPPLPERITLASGLVYWSVSVFLAYIHWFHFIPWLLRPSARKVGHASRRAA